jgi:hypothetical protein
MAGGRRRRAYGGPGIPCRWFECLTTRRIGGAERKVTSEITKLDPPARWAVRGIDGPVRAIVDVTVEPVDGSGRSRVTIELDFDGHGIGKLLVPLIVRREGRKEMPANVQRLGEQVEARASPPLA